jgi:hypothetical protein
MCAFMNVLTEELIAHAHSAIGGRQQQAERRRNRHSAA